MIHQACATSPDFNAEAHDGVAVNAGHALDGSDTASFRESCNHRDLFVTIENIRHQLSPDGLNVIQKLLLVKESLCYAKPVQNEEPSDNVRPNSEDDSSEPKPVSPPLKPNAPMAVNAQSVGENEIRNDVEDIRDRLKSAEKWMIWLTGAIVVVGICQFLAALLQWRAMEDQLTEMRVQRDLENRAWIKIVDVVPSDRERGVAMEAWDFSGMKTSQDVVIPKGVDLSFKASFQNVGHSPVLNMTAFYELTLPKLEDTGDSLLREEQRFCRSDPQRSEADWHAILFPDEPFEGTKRALSALRPENSVINGNKTEFLADLVVCVNYQYPGSTISHQTTAIHKLVYKDPRLPAEDWRDSIGLFSFTKPTINSKAEDIFLKRLGYADRAD